MNPITNMRNLNKMNDRELEMGLAGTGQSWHNEYKDSAWIFVGGLPYDLTEGDIICVFSQYGEIVHINLVRDLATGKSKGFAFICYEDQRSTILAVDNLNGMKLIGRLVRVDHVHTYKLPKDLEKMDADRRKLFLEGCAPKPIEENVANDSEESDEHDTHKSRKKKKKGEKRKKAKKKKSKRRSSSSSSSGDSDKNNQEDSRQFRGKHDKSNKESTKYDSRSHKSDDYYGSKDSYHQRNKQSFTSVTKDKSDREREIKSRRSRSRSRSPYRREYSKEAYRKDDRHYR